MNNLLANEITTLVRENDQPSHYCQGVLDGFWYGLILSGLWGLEWIQAAWGKGRRASPATVGEICQPQSLAA